MSEDQLLIAKLCCLFRECFDSSATDRLTRRGVRGNRVRGLFTDDEIALVRAIEAESVTMERRYWHAMTSPPPVYDTA